MAHYEGSAHIADLLRLVDRGGLLADHLPLTGIRFAVGPFLKPVVRDLDLDRALLLLGAGLSLSIDVAGRPRVRAELHPVAGGR